MSGFFDSFLRKVTGGLEMPNPKTEKLLEVNLGCFGGFDSQAMQKCWRRAYDQFLEYIKAGSPKHAKVTDFWEHLKTVEVKGTENLFSNSLDNLVNIIANQMSDFSEFKEFLLVSIGEEFKNTGEENYLLLEGIIKKLVLAGGEGEVAAGITVFDLLTTIKENELSGSNLNFLQNIFMFDDFTDEELKKEIEDSKWSEFYKKMGIDFVWAKRIFESGKIGSLYPRKLETSAGRDFAKKLKQLKDNSPLLVEPLYGEKIVTNHTQDLSANTENVKVEYDNKKVDLTQKVLKIDGTSSGDGIFMYHSDAHLPNFTEKDKYFNEFTLRQLTKDKEGRKKFTLEDFVHAPKIFVPYDLRNNQYGEMTEYTVDVRFGYYFDPSHPNEIQVISSYGRFNYPGEKSNIAKGGGVIDIKVVQDDKYTETKMKMLEMAFSLEKQDGEFFQEKLSENLQNDNLTYKGKPMAMSPLPFVISESAFERMKVAALQVAKNLKSDKPFMFALDAFLNPSPIQEN